MQILVVKTVEQGIERAKEKLDALIDNKTVLFLSGGQTPRPLYITLAKEGIIRPAAFAMVDERYGKRWHENSNERMIKETGLLTYADKANIPFYPILNGKSRGNATEVYDETVRKLFFQIPKSIGILGLGADGHTAGLPAMNAKIEYQMHDFVTSYNDITGKYGERITLTLAGLALLDFYIVFVFGKEKKKALKKIFTQGALEEIPGRFYTSSEAATKTLIITDQKI